MQRTAGELPKTQFSTELGNYNSGFFDSKIAVSQSFAAGSLYKKQKTVLATYLATAKAQTLVQKAELKKIVQQLYVELQVAEARKKILLKLDSLYSNYYSIAKLRFEKGELKGSNGIDYENPVEAIRTLSDLASPFAVGRDIHVGDTIIGIKGRVGFEAAAPLIIIKAHHTLEKHVLTETQLYWKEQLANQYGTMLHKGMFLEPTMRNIELFLEDMQQHVTGSVRVHLAPYHFYIMGSTSPYDLMSNVFGSYGERSMNLGDSSISFSK